MAEVLTLVMPKLGLTMTEGTVAEWPFKEGESFEGGATFLTVETDKVVNDVAAPTAGVITRILIPAGETVDVGTPLAEWEPKGSALLAVSSPDAASEAEIRGPRASKANAFQHKVAERMSEAKRTIPHFYLGTEVRADRLQIARKKWNTAAEKPHATITHLIVAAVARSIAKHSELNRVWNEDGFLEFDTVDIGIAVDTPQGLIAPLLRSADQLTLTGISQGVEDLVRRARTQQLVASDFGGGMMSVSNAGMHDVTWMTSIIDPAQAAILGVGSQRSVFRPSDDGSPQLVTEIGLVLSCDHRAFGGVQGLELLNEIRLALEAPDSLFVE